MNNFVCPTFDDLSAQWVFYDDNYEGEEDVNLKDGFFTLIDYLSSFLDENTQVNLNQVVTQIDWSQADKTSGEVILIHTTDPNTGLKSTYQCRNVVVSVSLNVLKNSDDFFVPPLPETKQAAINNLKMGDNNKLFFVFEAPVFQNDDITGLSFEWDNEGNSFSLPSDATCNLSVTHIYFNC